MQMILTAKVLPAEQCSQIFHFKLPSQFFQILIPALTSSSKWPKILTYVFKWLATPDLEDSDGKMFASQAV
jgi:hypothetical protein